MTAVKQGYQRILVATDFSTHSEAALRQAIWLARKSKAKVVVGHVLPDLRQAVMGTSYEARIDLLYGEGEIFQKELRRESDAKLEKLVSDLGATDLDITYETLIGEPFAELAHAVQAENYDLVLAGTRGMSAWEKLFIGSTTKQLIRTCPTDVWIVRAEHTAQPKVVLAATDFSAASLKAAQQGLWLAQQAGAAFHVLHIIDSNDAPESMLSRLPDGSNLRQVIKDESKRRLDEFLQSLSVDHTQVHAHLSLGTPWQETVRMAQQLNADVIAIGTVGRRGIRGMLLGNTAERVLNACTCSILTVKPDDYVSPIDPAFWPLHPAANKPAAG